MSTQQFKPNLRGSLPTKAQLLLMAQLGVQVGRPIATAAIGEGLAKAANTRVGRFLELDSLLAAPKPEGDTK